MKLVRSWLAEFVDLGKRGNQEIAADLESLGHEVENIESGGFSWVVIGQIITITPHPEADRVRVTTVDTGDKIRTIICGAPNIKVGQYVPVALPGAELPGGLTITERSIRGLISEGMICSTNELGLAGDARGILILSDQAKIGEPFGAESNETVFDVAITPNRGDAVSVLGLARDLAARYEQSLTWQPPLSTEESSEKVDVRIEASDLCPIYTARYLLSPTSAHLPNPVTTRLAAIGHGHYLPIVDFTNYVMEELGVPLHAFDADTLIGPLTVRRANSSESIKLLDGKTYDLTNDDLIIADRHGPIALAGIMGGQASSVSGKTTRIILEAAAFDAAAIRQTRRRLGLVSTASYRFERGTDPAMAAVASERVASLMKEYAKATIGPLTTAGAVPIQTHIILPEAAINARLGTDISRDQRTAILKRLGFTVEGQRVTVPTWRHDLSIPEDLAEEVARVIGLDNLPRRALTAQVPIELPDQKTWQQVEALKNKLTAAGWTEHIGTSFLSPKELSYQGIEKSAGEVIRLANPVSEEAAFLRYTLQISLARAIAKNPVYPQLRLFEIGTVWSKIPTKASEGALAPQTCAEVMLLSLAWTGTKPHGLPFLSTVGVTLSETIQKGLKIRRPVMVLESPLETILAEIGDSLDYSFQPTIPTPISIPSRFQPVLRDIAMVVDRSIDPDEIHKSLIGVDYLTDTELFDQFSGGQLPDRAQSLAFHLLFEHLDRTLTDQEITTTMGQVEEILKKKFQATIR